MGGWVCEDIWSPFAPEGKEGPGSAKSNSHSPFLPLLLALEQNPRIGADQLRRGADFLSQGHNEVVAAFSISLAGCEGATGGLNPLPTDEGTSLHLDCFIPL